MQGLFSNGQQEEESHRSFFTDFLPTRAIQPVLFLVSCLRWGGATYILMLVRQKDFS